VLAKNPWKVGSRAVRAGRRHVVVNLPRRMIRPPRREGTWGYIPKFRTRSDAVERGAWRGRRGVCGWRWWWLDDIDEYPPTAGCCSYWLRRCRVRRVRCAWCAVRMVVQAEGVNEHREWSSGAKVYAPKMGFAVRWHHIVTTKNIGIPLNRDLVEQR